MIRCTVCIYPLGRPDTHFVDGVCSGCISYAARANIDWPARKLALVLMLTEAKARGAAYDCVVPVSGGKDSTFQVITLLDMGARVLAVNAGTDMLSDIGRRNLDNLKRYCDVIEWTPNTEVRKKLIRAGLRLAGGDGGTAAGRRDPGHAGTARARSGRHHGAVHPGGRPGRSQGRAAGRPGGP